MSNYCFMTLVLLLEVLAPLPTGSFSPPTPTCDQPLIKDIKKFWQATGTHRKVLELLESCGHYAVIEITSTFLNGNDKCIFLDGSESKSTLSFIVTPKDNSQNLVTFQREVDEENGIIVVKKTGQKIFIIHADEKVIVGYLCVPTGGENCPSLGFIALNHKSWSDGCAQKAVRFSRGIMNLLGFKFLYDFGKECFK